MVLKWQVEGDIGKENVHAHYSGLLGDSSLSQHEFSWKNVLKWPYLDDTEEYFAH